MSSAAKRTNYFTLAALGSCAKRLRLHESGNVASTAKRRPLRLMYSEACLDERDAFVERNILKAHMGSATLEHDAGITSQAKEGFKRTHLPEKIQFYNIACGSTGEVRSLLYVISDNYPRSAPEAERLRSTAVSVGKLVSGVLRSTEGR
jgi:hypothetical protein